MRRTMIAVGLGMLLVATIARAQPTSRHGFHHGSDEATNATIDRLDARLPLLLNGRPVFSAVFCGQLTNGGVATVSYMGPVEVQDGTGAGEGLNGPIDAGSTVCDASDSTTEATADAPIFTNIPIYPLGMYCRAVTGAGATGSGALGVNYALRVAAAAPTAALACDVPTGAIDCSAWYGRDVDVPKVSGGATMAIRTTVGVEDLSANDGWCRLFYTF